MSFQCDFRCVWFFIGVVNTGEVFQLTAFDFSILPLWIPIGLTVLLVFSQNFSTAAIIGLMAFVLCFIGGYPLKYLIGISLALAAAAALFLTVLMKSPESIPSDRAVTWKNRVETFLNPETASADSRHQITLANFLELGDCGDFSIFCC